jgi:hypothetical protein
MNALSKSNRKELAPQPNPISRISESLAWFKNVFDYLGGSREEPPAGMPFLSSPWWFGLWWGLMIGLILLFCGQTSKFIYIDF